MIDARDFVDAALEQGFDWYAGVPCSFLTPFINYVIGADKLEYFSAANEGDAVAAAAGAWIGGRKSVAMMQNSGLGNAVSPLTSLTHTFKIPILVICTHRGAPGVSDEPQHELMGQITHQLFDTMQIPNATFPREASAISPALAKVESQAQSERRPFALIMQKGTCAPYALPDLPVRSGAPKHDTIDHGDTNTPRATRQDLLKHVVELTSPKDTVVIASTGFSGRELFAIDDRPNHLYMVGSMGCASSLGLGLASARPDLKVVVVDGDGAALMRMGNLATIGAYAPSNLYHLLLDNEAHDSTGAQATVSAKTEFAHIAAACGYASTLVTTDPAVFASDMNDWLGNEARPGASLAHVKIQTGTLDPLPRPSIAPHDVLDRLMDHLGTRR